MCSCCTAADMSKKAPGIGYVPKEQQDQYVKLLRYPDFGKYTKTRKLLPDIRCSVPRIDRNRVVYGSLSKLLVLFLISFPSGVK